MSPLNPTVKHWRQNTLDMSNDILHWWGHLMPETTQKINWVSTQSAAWFCCHSWHFSPYLSIKSIIKLRLIRKKGPMKKTRVRKDLKHLKPLLWKFKLRFALTFYFEVGFMSYQKLAEWRYDLHCSQLPEGIGDILSSLSCHPYLYQVLTQTVGCPCGPYWACNRWPVSGLLWSQSHRDAWSQMRFSQCLVLKHSYRPSESEP